jgi:glyoxylase-like metal-dependent hydrolase (beta-lactamase superfamily II)
MKKTTFGVVTQLAFLPRLFPINVYLVDEEDGTVLIDGGMPFCSKGILEAIEATGKPLVRILLTHAHGDHIGGVKAVKAAYPDARIGISARDARLLQGDLSIDEGEAKKPIKGDVPKKAPFTPDFTFSDGESIGSLKVVAAPGHTPGQVAFWHEASGVLVAGDAFQTRGGIAVSGHMRWSFPFPAMATWDGATALESARKLLELNPSYLAVGHGQVLAQPRSILLNAIKEAEKAIQRRKSS